MKAAAGAAPLAPFENFSFSTAFISNFAAISIRINTLVDG
jgi:hypothetical protein